MWYYHDYFVTGLRASWNYKHLGVYLEVMLIPGLCFKQKKSRNWLKFTIHHDTLTNHFHKIFNPGLKFFFKKFFLRNCPLVVSVESYLFGEPPPYVRHQLSQRFVIRGFDVEKHGKLGLVKRTERTVKETRLRRTFLQFGIIYPHRFYENATKWMEQLKKSNLCTEKLVLVDNCHERPRTYLERFHTEGHKFQ